MNCPYPSRALLIRLMLVAICSELPPGTHSRTFGDEFVWVGDQNEFTPGFIPAGWAFNDGTMWLGFAGPPASVDDVAVFGGGYVDPFTGNPFRWGNGGTIFFGDFASIHAPLKGGPTQIEQIDAVTRSVRIQSGEWTFDFTSVAFPSGQSIGTDTGRYTITDVLNVGDSVKATGSAGTATLNIINSGLHTTTTQVGRGSVNETSIVGTLNVLGPDTVWNNSADITVGHDNGKGTLNLSGGATVTASNLVVGLVGGEGDATLSNGSSLDLSGALSVGVLATFGGGGPTSNGSVTVTGGSTLNSTGFARIGESQGATGTVTINGPGSQWTNAGGSSIGFEGSGTLQIVDGGEVNTFGTVIVGSANGTGSVTIGGPFSRPTSWAVQGDLNLFNGHVTINSFGELHQSNGQMVVGGTMTSTTIDILQNGELTTGLLLIGSEGVAVMDNHGFVNTDGSAVLGVNESGDGQAIVWGVDAEWAVNGILTIGGAGHGSLDVTGGSVVRMIGGEIARDNGSTGEMHIDAAQVISESSTADDFNVGIHGQASLSLHGGQLDIVNGNVFVGRGKGSDATVNVDGASKMTANRDFIIAANEGVLGSPSNATVNVTDGSTLEVTESLLVGENGVGALNVSNSDVNSRVGRIGIAGGSTGRVSLLDARWSITEYLSVGENGIGELMVTDGGVINSKRSLIATNANGQGAVQMSNGVWTSNDLTVGENGVGSFEAVQFSMVEINDGMIGRNDGSIGTIILSQSSLVSGGPERADFEVGLHGEATMSLFASSARIDHGNLFIGRGRGSTGTVNVDISSILSINGDVIIAAGEGEGESRSNATVNVTNGSVLETPHGLLVGENGIGALNVSGSDVISRIGRIGVTDGSEGSVSLVGASNWTIGESLIVGEEGAGTLSVSDYSFVQIDSLLQVGNEGLVDLVLSEGRINIGGGGLPADVGILRVGDGGLLAGGGIINGNVVVDGGSISPGFSPGMLTIDGDLSITALGSLSIEIGGETPGLDNDVLDVTGNIDIDGTIFITLIDGYRPGRGDVFNLLHFGGDFDPLSLSQIVFTNGPAGFEYELGLTSGVASVVVTVPEVGSLSFLGVASVFVGLAVRYRHKCV